MTKYAYINSIRKSTVRLGISTKVFLFIANKAIKSVNGILLNDDDTTVSANLRNNVVVFRVNAAINKGADKNSIKTEIIENITNSMNFICDSMSFEISVKFIEKKEKDNGKWNYT